MLSGLPLKSLIHLKLTFMIGKDGVLFHSFACEFVVFLTLFIEETILLHWVFLASLSNITYIDNIRTGLSLGSEFCCIGLCVCFYASTIFSWYLSFVIWFEIRNFNVFKHFSFFLGLLWVFGVFSNIWIFFLKFLIFFLKFLIFGFFFLKIHVDF